MQGRHFTTPLSRIDMKWSSGCLSTVPIPQFAIRRSMPRQSAGPNMSITHSLPFIFEEKRGTSSLLRILIPVTAKTKRGQAPRTEPVPFLKIEATAFEMPPKSVDRIASLVFAVPIRNLVLG